MAYDPIRDRTVLFGGRGAGGVPLGDLWEWDGSNWREQTGLLGGPEPRAEFSMAYNPQRRRVVLFGGDVAAVGDQRRSDTWEWDGENWTNVSPPLERAPTRSEHALVYFAAGGELLMLGGSPRSVDPPPTDTVWSLRFGDPVGPCSANATCDDPNCWPLCTPTCPPGVSCGDDEPGCGDGSCNTALEDALRCPADCP